MLYRSCLLSILATAAIAGGVVGELVGIVLIAVIVIVIVIIVKNKKELNITARLFQCACTVQ